MCIRDRPEGPQGIAGNTGPTGATGPQGNAATIQIGTVTTGEPGTPAEVTNSGTEQNAILNFVIPRGATGGSGISSELYTAYSTPPQPGANRTPFVFDRDGAIQGSAIVHTPRTANFLIQQTGYYEVSFHGTISPFGSPTFPMVIIVYLQLQGAQVLGTCLLYTSTVFFPINGYQCRPILLSLRDRCSGRHFLLRGNLAGRGLAAIW